MLVDIYIQPRGDIRRVDIRNVYPADERFFEEYDIVVSMEELSGEYIIYGYMLGTDPEETEQIVFANGRSCEDALHELVELCKQEYRIED